MKHLYFVLTARCNEVCKICPRSDSDRIKDRDLEWILNKLKEDIIEGEITDITLSGGEPSVYNYFSEVVHYLDKMNVRVNILSNSLRFSDVDFARKCFGDLKIKSIFV